MTTHHPATTTATPRPGGGFTTYRSALTLSPQAQDTCHDIHRLHQLVLEGFRDPRHITAQPAAPPEHILYAAQRATPIRETSTRRLIAGRPHTLLVQSPTRPDWTPLLQQGRLAHAHTFTAHHTLHPGQSVECRIIANPTRRCRATRRRLALRTHQEAGAWLRRHLATGGLHIQPHAVSVGETHRLTGTTSSGHPLKILIREMRARATVTDPHALHRLLHTGTGPAKPYGCGLLLLRPTVGS